MLDYDDKAESLFDRLKGIKGRPATKDLRIASIALSHKHFAAGRGDRIVPSAIAGGQRFPWPVPAGRTQLGIEKNQNFL